MDTDNQDLPESKDFPQVEQVEEEVPPAVDWEDKYKRALADYQNLSRQHSKERLEFIKYANQNLISELLPIIDHLLQAQSHLKDQGIGLVLKQINQLLKSYQVEQISPQAGDLFNPELHECIETVETESEKPDTIVSLVTPGYQWQSGPVIRHAQVTVYKLPEETLDSN